MDKQRALSRTRWIQVVACCGMFSAAAVAAQPLDEIVVTAQRLTQTTIVGRSATTGAPTELVTLTHRVDYDDLDLIKHADVLTLQQRVETAAKTACRQLDRLYPVAAPQSEECTRKALRDAGPQIDQAIAQAASRKAHG